jgi:hypothetical protein
MREAAFGSGSYRSLRLLSMLDREYAARHSYSRFQDRHRFIRCALIASRPRVILSCDGNNWLWYGNRYAFQGRRFN